MSEEETRKKAVRTSRCVSQLNQIRLRGELGLGIWGACKEEENRREKAAHQMFSSVGRRRAGRWAPAVVRASGGEGAGLGTGAARTADWGTKRRRLAEAARRMAGRLWSSSVGRQVAGAGRGSVGFRLALSRAERSREHERWAGWRFLLRFFFY